MPCSIWKHMAAYGTSRFSDYLLGLNIQMLTGKHFRKYRIYEDGVIEPICQASTDM